jgi:hypothetical protein
MNKPNYNKKSNPHIHRQVSMISPGNSEDIQAFKSIPAKMQKSGISICLIIMLLFCISCEKGGTDSSSGSNSGTGGSLAKFTIHENRLYTVDGENLKVFSLENSAHPQLKTTIPVGFAIETIFAHQNTLFLGSEMGMYIYDISNPDLPGKLSYYQHILSCDPVVANDSVAYVTLRTESFCGSDINELQVVNIKDKTNPFFVSRNLMTQPKGLGTDGQNLFVCDDVLKLFSLADPYHPVLLKRFQVEAQDVIPDNNLLLVLSTNGLDQYSYQNDTIKFISHIQ